MLRRFRGKAILALALAFPVAALADINGSLTIPASFTLSLDTGALKALPGDIQWNLTTSTIRAITTSGTAKLFNIGNLGSAGFASLTSSVLTSLVYTATSIDGNNDSTNVLVPGDVFAVQTNGGNYAKVLVVGYVTNSTDASVQNIEIQYYTYGQVFAHLAMGPLGSDVWTTAIILNNATNSPASFTINFIQDTGQPLPLGTGIYVETHQAGFMQTQNGQSVSGTIAARSTATEVLSASSFVQGWASLSGPGITGQAVFHRHTSGGADYEATVPVATGGTEYLVPFDATSYYNGTTQVTTLPYITGMALVNLDPSNTATIICTIADPNGVSLGSAAPITIPPLRHTALQLDAASGFGNVAGNIGSLDCSSTGSSFAVLGLRFLGTNDLTSFAAVKLH